MKDTIKDLILKSISVKNDLYDNDLIIEEIMNAANICIDALKSNNKILLAGNGGSAADSQHIAAELVGRFYINREALPAIALTTDTSAITAIGNDFGFENIFSRQLEALGNKGDVFIGFSTSGNSENIIRAAKFSKENEIKVIAVTGSSGGKLIDVNDIIIKSPSDDIPRIQETHIMIGHIICEIIEKEIFT